MAGGRPFTRLRRTPGIWSFTTNLIMTVTTCPLPFWAFRKCKCPLRKLHQHVKPLIGIGVVEVGPRRRRARGRDVGPSDEPSRVGQIIFVKNAVGCLCGAGPRESG